MSAIRVIDDDEESQDTQRCLCYWLDGLRCPNAATWRVENLTNQGYSLMCTPHKEGFQHSHPGALVGYIALRAPAEHLDK